MDPENDFRFEKAVPSGEDRERLVCTDCGWIHYVNPRIIVGAVCTWEDRFLLCEREIEPRRGYWTLPAGFLEEGESAPTGAAREAMEEANARIEIDALLAVYSIPRISQIQLIYRARLLDAGISPGPESRAVRLVTWDEIPWDELAFPSARWALHHFREVEGRDVFAPFTEPAD